MRLRPSLCSWGLVTCFCSVVDATELGKEAPGEVQTIPLKAVGTVLASKGGFLAWIEPVLSDGKGNVYLLALPQIPRQADPNTDVPRPRDVLRISADGKKRSTVSPMKSPKLATAAKVTTAAITLDPDGALSMLVWARWRGSNDGDERTGQYIVSFDNEGEYRSEVEVDWQELGVIQFEAFGAGQFLLRGRSGSNREEVRLAVLSGNGLKEVVDGVPSSGVPEQNETSAPGRRAALVSHMVRGGDGRIYVTQPGEHQGESIVFAISASGETEKLFTLPRMPGDLPLLGLRAAGGRLAAAYLEGGGVGGRWWIAVYGNVASDAAASPVAVYGPAPGAPVSYRQEGTGDIFTFLKEGSFVTMTSP